MNFNIQIFVDGSCLGNPGPAGIGVILICGDHKREISKNIGLATNNIAEISAVVMALQALHRPERCDVELFTDSQLVEGLLVKGWKAKANVELVAVMRHLASACKSLSVIKLLKAKVTGDHKLLLDRCDELAKTAATLGSQT